MDKSIVFRNGELNWKCCHEHQDVDVFKDQTLVKPSYGLKRERGKHLLYRNVPDTVLTSEESNVNRFLDRMIHYNPPSEIMTFDQPVFSVIRSNGTSCNSYLHQNMIHCRLDKSSSTKSLCHVITVFRNLKKKDTFTSQALFYREKEELSRIYLRYQRRIKKYILSLGVTPQDAEDINQTVFAQTCHDYANGNRIAHLERYLFGVTRNIVREYHRHKDNHLAEFILESAENLIQHRDSHEQTMTKEQDSVYRIIETLPFKYRQAIELRFFQGLSPQSASKRAKCPPNTFYQRVHVALRMLKDKVQFPPS